MATSPSEAPDTSGHALPDLPEEEPRASRRKEPGSPWVELIKPRITQMVLVTAAVGFLLGHRPEDGGEGFPWMLLLHTLVGTGLVSSSASCLNQVIERSHDGLMRRTAGRPLPTGKVDPTAALLLGVVLGIVGLAQLAFAVNLLTAFLGAVTLAGYLFVYTPMKRVSSLATVVGAAPGAVPPMMGWTAVTGSLGAGAWALFGILFFWQLPHFLAIAWMYRADYARGGYPMLPVVAPDGGSTARQAILWAATLVPLSLLPSALGLTGAVYAIGAFLLGIGFFAASVAFGRRPNAATARRLLLVSVAYLPALLAVMMVDRALF